MDHAPFEGTLSQSLFIKIQPPRLPEPINKFAPRRALSLQPLQPPVQVSGHSSAVQERFKLPLRPLRLSMRSEPEPMCSGGP